MHARHLWLASYPRSGNTLLRAILYQCFSLPSASVYPQDLADNAKLATIVGHLDGSLTEPPVYPAGAPHLMKTHHLPEDDCGTIYIVRNGRDACISLWNFWKRVITLEDVIAGRHQFGTWAAHLQSWKPWERSNSLLLRYEDVTSDLPGTLGKLSRFLDRGIQRAAIPTRSEMSDGRWVRPSPDGQSTMTPEQMELFNRINGQMMKRLGYDTQ